MLETSISPVAASAATRAPMWTAIPPSFSPIGSTSPVRSPAPISNPSSRTPRMIAQAQRMPRAGPSNAAKKPSPAVSTSRPRETVGKELVPRPVRRDAADPFFLPGPPDRPGVPGEASTRPHPVRVEDPGDLLVVPPGRGQGAHPLNGGRRRAEELAPVYAATYSGSTWIRWSGTPSSRRR